MSCRNNSWSQVYNVHPPQKGNRVLVAVGPGNNGMYVGAQAI